ncbi:MAG: hypothetical protein QXJ02_01550 [Candidatus Bathyarchaeia archaeon]
MKVLFVCSGNAHRSPLAEALLKKARPDWAVDSAGISVSIPIAEQVKRYLAKESAEAYLKSFPEALATKKVGSYDLVVAMEQKHRNYVLAAYPDCVDRVVVWNIEDPYFMSPEEAEKIYNRIKEKVQQLAGSM